MSAEVFTVNTKENFQEQSSYATENKDAFPDKLVFPHLSAFQKCFGQNTDFGLHSKWQHVVEKIKKAFTKKTFQ